MPQYASVAELDKAGEYSPDGPIVTCAICRNPVPYRMQYQNMDTEEILCEDCMNAEP